MKSKIYVGNLPFSFDNAELENVFKEFGTVASANVIMDRDSGRSKGFGFVEMSSGDEAQAAVDALDGKEVSGRNIRVNEAKDNPRRGGGGGGNYRR